MRLPGGFADEVKSQSDIVRIVSDYVTLKKRGANYVARCPFHSEKTPSFNVNQGKGIFKCFGCGAGGSVFDFIMQIEGCGFPEAVRLVAVKMGIQLPAMDSSAEQKKSQHERDSVLRLNEWAAEFFEQQLLDTGLAAGALDYMKSRSISEISQKRFRIGYAPDSWDTLIHHLLRRGAGRDEIDKSGLVVLKDDGKSYDRFRGRVMFPILDAQNRVVAFGGRVMGPGEPKYLNSPETAVYVKGRHLYGLSLAKSDIRAQGFAVLVEGYLDCIIPMQEGIGNIVASLGTALTDGQVRLLRRYMDRPRVIVNFDPDAAGQSAALRSIELFLSEGFTVQVLKMPTKEDPDEFVRSKGAPALKSLFSSAMPYVEFVISRAVDQFDTSRPAGKVDAINSILPHLVRLPDRVARAEYAAQIADRLRVDSRLIREELGRAATYKRASLDARRIVSAGDVTKAERQLLELLLLRDDVRASILPNLSADDYQGLPTEALFQRILELEAEGAAPDFDSLRADLPGDIETTLLPALFIADLSWAEGDDFDNLFKHASEALTALRCKKLEARRQAIQSEISQGEREGRQDLASLYEEKAGVARLLKQLTSRSGSV